MRTKKEILGNYHYCTVCNKVLSEDYELELCPHCIETMLFQEVREYIRQNDVTEYEVAEYFNLPIGRVRAWIKEGRIQYNGSPDGKELGVHCARCGKPIFKGEICVECMAIIREQKSFGYVKRNNSEASKVRFMRDALR